MNKSTDESPKPAPILMNVAISGPFGLGSFADELVLGGVLRHLAAGKHDVTVLSADPAAPQAIHGVKAVEPPSPSGLFSPPAASEVVSKAHLFVLASAGVINDYGSRPARAWLAQLE